jgi:nucleotide-binding universal stress UspA family protein
MRILICSDGTDPADKPVKLGGLLAGPCNAATTLLGIAEKPADEQRLRAALESEGDLLRSCGVSPEIVIMEGEPIRQILNVAAGSHYDITIIGARPGGRSELYCYSERTYEVIKAIPSPVLVAKGNFERVSSILICTGGKHYIEDAVQLTGKLAACVGASVTLLHVMAEPPAIYADLVRLEEDVEGLLASSSELGVNLRAQKEVLEKLGVPAQVRVRHGIAIDQIFAEVGEGNYDIVVTGSSQARGPLRHYIMGDLTHSILNRASCPVLVARAGPLSAKRGGFWNTLKAIFASSPSVKVSEPATE